MLLQLLVLISFLLLKGFHPPFFDRLNELVDLESLPLGGQEPALGFSVIKGVNELLFVVKFDLEIEGIDVSVCISVASNSLNHL